MELKLMLFFELNFSKFNTFSFCFNIFKKKVAGIKGFLYSFTSVTIVINLILVPIFDKFEKVHCFVHKPSKIFQNLKNGSF